MFNLPFSAIDCCISINADLKSITFYSINKKNKQDVIIEHETYKAKAFEEDFYEMLKNSVGLRFKTAGRSGRVVLILPDALFLTDNIKIPIIQKKAMANSLSLAISALYNNSRDIKYSTTLLTRDKKTATYGIVGVRKQIIAKMTDAIERAGASVYGITFRANSCVNGAIALNSKLKTSNFVLVDIKQDYTCFSFVSRGSTIGYYSLPFGYSIIKDNVVKDEITLFDHTAGDLLVLNAKEKAKRKQLTSLDDEDDADEQIEQAERDLDNEFVDENNEEDAGEFIEDDSATVKVGALYKRINRKLPKFMLRPIPSEPQEFEYENFRVFVKWALELIRNNAEALVGGTPDQVVVNMPERFYHILERVNSEQAENKIVFQPLSLNKQNEINKNNLELFGGLYIKKFNKNNNF